MATILCRVCLEPKPPSSQPSKICADCYRAYLKDYRSKHLDHLKEINRANWRKRRQEPEYCESERKRGRQYWNDLRHEVIVAYGGFKCACCGETEPRFLTIDHVFNDGAKHRRELDYVTKVGNGKGLSGAKTWKWLKDHNYPAGFQVLCMNCNFGKARNGGVCPHKSPVLSENRVNSVDTQTG